MDKTQESIAALKSEGFDFWMSINKADLRLRRLSFEFQSLSQGATSLVFSQALQTLCNLRKVVELSFIVRDFQSNMVEKEGSCTILNPEPCIYKGIVKQRNLDLLQVHACDSDTQSVDWYSALS